MKTLKPESPKLFWSLGILVLVQWVFLAFGVKERMTWVLENLLLVLFIGPLVYYYLKGSLSTTSYVLFVVFVLFHNVGAHYTYSEVPYNQWSQAIFGTSINDMLGLERNHYDRLVHFLFGFLLMLPVIDFLENETPLKKGFWVLSYAILLHVTASTAYEMIEWTAAEIFGGETGTAYLGTQGDPWDAQKDMALATLGAFLGIGFMKCRK